MNVAVSFSINPRIKGVEVGKTNERRNHNMPENWLKQTVKLK